MNLKALRALQQRVRDSSGADRRLDVAILDALSDPNAVVLPHFTASLDACVALLNAVQPGCEWSRLSGGHFAVHGNGSSFAAPPLATDCHTFIDAILSAFIAQLEAAEAA